ncbi:MAG: outer membrane protein assembly factor BamB [Gammaproteobacteria bacterium]|nr:outer membrane protein assembly factor BamB [Gammaproteobacteria bacterium]MDH3863350.1 outer membrane protein assembly factor BamB [Gammaproteobacteria bacterium]MDH3905809.1 outer membrane protein assembly factor BamB [Gammaproteobacteria bacterium]MDH4004488.1 outer membrane protein assembly factor BamB [Gammaproteobacteria bacterium]NCF58918.1 outer membrane protein assembly factor BamB [Gammaproteobacteria bacterium]
MTPLGRNLLALSAALMLSACGLFGDDDEELEPAELIDFEAKVKIKRLWKTKIGADAEFLRVALRPMGDGNRIYAASVNGIVVALDPESGKQVWRNKLGISLSSGPGVGEGLVVVVAADGDVVALSTEDGTERWRAYISGESLATPLVYEEWVIVQTVDNKLTALSVFDGADRWTVEQSTPALTMRGSTSPMQVGQTVVTGFDNGRVMAIDLSSGDVEWDSMLAPPSGRSDLDRLSDIDGDIAVVGQDIYASGYQGRIASLAAESGQVLWAREISTYEGVSADWNNVYSTLDNGELVALNRRSGTEIWRQNALLRREPTVPMSFRTTVAVGDLEGYLHFFSNVDGEPVARVRAGKSAIVTTPVVMADRLYVQSDDGSISAWYVVEPKRDDRRAPDTAEGDDESA